MLRSLYSGRLALYCAFAWLALSSFAVASEYHGQVTMAGLPVPGVTVTAAQGEKKLTAVTDTQGLYSFPDLADGTWTISIEMTGFSAIKQDVAIAPNATPGAFELKLQTLDEIRAADKPLVVEASAPVVAAASTVAAPTAAAVAAAKPAAKPQQPGAPPPPPEPPAEESAASDGLLINGSSSNAATSQYSLAPAFGNQRNGGRSLYNGGLSLMLENSSLDAKAYSLTGTDTAKPGYNDITAGFTFGGPIKIPRVMPRGPNFTVGYQWTRNSNDTTQSALVPTAAEQGGDLSQAPNVTAIYVPTVAGLLPAACLSTPGITAGAAFPGNVIPAACLSTQAQMLLAKKYYPAPNVTGDPSFNYQAPLVSSNHSDSAQVRLSKSASQRDYLYGNFAFSSTRTSNANLFNFVDTTDGLGMNAGATWQHRVHQRMFMNLTYNFSRQATHGNSFFASRDNVSKDVGIGGNLQGPQDAMYWGPPNLSFSSGIVGISDPVNSSFNRNETNALGYAASWNRGRHNVQFGADFRRQEFNYLAQSNPRGSLGFNGTATLAPSGTAGTGSDFADFLLGIPDTSSIAYGNADKYLRQSYYDAYINDDWRARPELTINAGIRWEYAAPITELKGRLVNLDVAPNFTAVAPVLGSNPVGALTGQQYPTSLVRPDKHGFQPKVGVSWRPISGSSLVLKSGYGITFDTSVYSAIAINMDQQAPLSTSLNATNATPINPTCPFTLANPFTFACTSASTTDTFGIDPNYRIGYAQNWQLSVQRDLPFSLQLTATYLGIKGTRALQLFYPNSTAPIVYTPPATPPPPCTMNCPPSGFQYRVSDGDSTREAGQVQLRRRLRAGFTATVTYTYSKALDDVSGFGGQGSGVAQNWQNLRGERGLSSFDQRNVLNVYAQYTTGMGLGGKTLLSGWRGLIYKGWTALANITYGSGLPETPIYSGSLVGGVCSCLRPNVTGAPIHIAAGGRFLNPAAYSQPTSGFGDARRDSITGPNQFTMNASMQRSFRLHDRYNLDFTLAANNPLNHVTYTSYGTTINTSQFGAPTNTVQMRKVIATMRLRF